MNLPAIRTPARRCEVARFAALCSDDYEIPACRLNEIQGRLVKDPVTPLTTGARA